MEDERTKLEKWKETTICEKNQTMSLSTDCFICKNMKEFFKHTRRENKIYSFQEAIAHLHFEYSSSRKKNIVTKSCFSCPRGKSKGC